MVSLLTELVRVVFESAPIVVIWLELMALSNPDTLAVLHLELELRLAANFIF